MNYNNHSSLIFEARSVAVAPFLQRGEEERGKKNNSQRNEPFNSLEHKKRKEERNEGNRFYFIYFDPRTYVWLESYYKNIYLKGPRFVLCEKRGIYFLCVLFLPSSRENSLTMLACVLRGNAESKS